MKKVVLIGLLSILSGCVLFRPAIRKHLLPMEMTEVDGGTFMMGDVIEEEDEDALPLHEVTLEDYAIGTYEVTYEQFDAFAEATGRPLPDDDGRGRGKRAVVFVNWYDAKAFCNAYGYRLPTEQEWEYAARSGGLYHTYSGTSEPDSLDHYARYAENSGAYSYLVGTKRHNDLGIFDMSGNVSEFIGEYYSFYRVSSDSLEYYPLHERPMRIIRGGSFNSPESILRTYKRVGVFAEPGDHTIGFRCVNSD